MQKIRSILKIGNSGAELCDNCGSTVGVSLQLMLGTAYMLEFELRREADGESAVLPDYPANELGAAACYCAFDFSCQNSDAPPLLITTGVDMISENSGRTLFTVPLVNSAAEQITSALKGRPEIGLICELGGFDADGKPVFAWQFPVTLCSRIYLGNGNETIARDPEYYTAVQVEAIAAGLSGRISQIGVETSGFAAEIARIGSETAGFSAELARLEAKIPAEKEVIAGTLPVSDSAGYFAGETVEAVLQEIGSQLEGVENILGGI